MEDLLIQLATEIPSVVAIIVVIILFLRALRQRDSTIKDIADNFAEAMREHTEEGKNLRETLGAHSEVIKRCQQVISQQ